ncbi:unnamed protein product, partial [Allacma fusca]
MSPFPNKIIYCYGERQSELFEGLKKDLEEEKGMDGANDDVSNNEPNTSTNITLLDDKPSVQIEFVKGFEYDIPEENTIPTILVLDDLMDGVSKNKAVVDLFTRGSHHRSISVFLLVQNFFFPNMRTITLN